jgi:hypothetical protein
MKCLRTYEEEGDQFGIASAHQMLGSIELHLANIDEARTLAEQSLAEFEDLGDPSGAGDALETLARVRLHGKDVSAARVLFLEAFRRFSGLSARDRIAGVLEGLAATESAAGRFQTAAMLLAKAHTVRQDSGTPIPLFRLPAVETCVETARSALGEAAFEEASQLGAFQELDRLMAFISPDA